MEQPNALPKEFWVEALHREGRDFHDAVAKSDLSLPVPSCPEWTASHLVEHLGGAYAWVRQVVEAAGEKSDRRDAQPPDDDLLTWFDEVLAGLVTVLDAVDPDAPAWNWSTQPQVARFWPRRVAHETAVHRWDAQLISRLAKPVDAELAGDGVSEVLDTWLPAGRTAVKNDAQGVVRLMAQDIDRTWLVRLRANGLNLLDETALLDDAPEAQTQIGGTASDLLLALWGRVPVSALAVDGDPARFEALRTG